MKQAFIILLIATYALTSFGVRVKGFYCCGNLTSVSLSFGNSANEKARKSNTKDDCCKTKTQYYKVSDSHLSSDDVTAPAGTVLHLPVVAAYPNLTAFAATKPQAINSSHAPPLHNGVAVYVSHCMFRI